MGFPGEAVEVRRRVTELVTAITRYRQLHGLHVDLRIARSVEELQARIIVRLKSEEVLHGSSTAREALSRLLDERRDLILEFYREAADLTGDPPDPGDLESILASALRGDVERPGSKSMLLVLQAIARAVAEIREESGGSGAELSIYCPVCGAASETMARRRGWYYMICHFCGYTWRVSGELLTCPNCGATAPIDVGVVTDKHKRLGLAGCQRCGYTWRVLMDEHVRAPNIVIPLIAMGAERYRSALTKALELAKSGDVEVDGSENLY